MGQPGPAVPVFCHVSGPYVGAGEASAGVSVWWGEGGGRKAREENFSYSTHTLTHTHTHSSYTLQPVGSGHKPNWRSPRKGGYNREANRGHAFYSSLPGNKGGGRERERGKEERKKERKIDRDIKGERRKIQREKQNA